MLKGVEPAVQPVSVAPVAPPAPKAPEPVQPTEKPAPPLVEAGTVSAILVASGSTFLGVPLWLAGAVCVAVVVAAMAYVLLNKNRA